jgi:putative membrane protein
MRFMNSLRVESLRLILRDQLAIERTVLANERTALAYFRTTMALVGGGGTVLRFFWDTPALVALGGILAAVGLGIGGLGIRRYRAVNQHLRSITHSTVGEDPPPESRS